MVFLYQVLIVFAVVAKWFVSLHCGRRKQLYESEQQVYDNVETDVKLDQVAHNGRLPTEVQLKLMRYYNRKEDARQKWVAAENRLKGMTQRVDGLRAFQSRKVPYAAGFLDMALVMELVDQYHGNSAWLEQLIAWVNQWLQVWLA